MESRVLVQFVVCRHFPDCQASSAKPHVNGLTNELPTLSKRYLYRADFTHALRVQSHRTDTENTLPAEIVVCGYFPDGQSSSAKPHVNGHTNEHPTPSKRELYAADLFQALRERAHIPDTETTLRAEFGVCGHFPDGQASSTKPHVNVHLNEHTTLSKRELYTEILFQVLRVQAHRTDTETTLQVQFVVCGYFPDGQDSSAKPNVIGHQNEHQTLSKRHLYRADFTHALKVQSHRTDTETTLRAKFGVCGYFPDGQVSSARPQVHGHTDMVGSTLQAQFQLPLPGLQ